MRSGDALTFGERLADKVVGAMGSWHFIVYQTVIVGVWVALNLVAFAHHWDPYPFILLNLAFSTQAAYAAPLILMASNRSGRRDAELAHNDYEINRKALEILTILKTHLVDKNAEG